MADSKITALAAITQIDPAVDVVEITDVSDTSMDATGTNKKVTSDFVKYAALAGIQGLELAFNSTTVLRVKAGKIGVNGKVVTFTQTDYTSASTMKTIANVTVTLAANKCYNVFISDAGVIGINLNDSTGDSVPPVFNTTYDYWASASTGAAWRRIGKFWTDASSHILKFICNDLGRYREFELYSTSAIQLVSAVQGTGSYVSTAIAPYISADDAKMAVRMEPTSRGAGTDYILLSIDGGTNVYGVQGLLIVADANNVVYGPSYWVPNSGTLHNSGTTNTTINITLTGVSMVV
jgi:hypothetical protein